jgi:hypothetical protein
VGGLRKNPVFKELKLIHHSGQQIQDMGKHPAFHIIIHGLSKMFFKFQNFLVDFKITNNRGLGPSEPGPLGSAPVMSCKIYKN